jgi:hypothetical protein
LCFTLSRLHVPQACLHAFCIFNNRGQGQRPLPQKSMHSKSQSQDREHAPFPLCAVAMSGVMASEKPKAIATRSGVTTRIAIAKSSLEPIVEKKRS